MLSQSLGKVTLRSLRSALPSHCFSAVGVVWASRPFPEHSLCTGEQELDYSSPGPYKARVSQGGKCQKEFWCAGGMLAAHSGVEGVGDQREPNSTWEHTHVGREDKLHTKVSRRQTGLRVGREKRSGGSQLREEPRGAGWWLLDA